MSMRLGWRWLGALLFALPVMLDAADAKLQNRLADHPSPYLAMHGDDPVHWQPWDADTLARARALNRPLLVSIGYFACHWCHVMQRESYRDARVARLLNRFFIPVKVDRELSPALDAYLIEFVELTRGQAGWPLNVLLTPDGYPMLGMTYLPRERFHLLLAQFRRRWAADEQGLREAASAGMEEWRALREAKPELSAKVTAPVKQLLDQARPLMDELAGGFGEQNKFPMVAQLLALLATRDGSDTADINTFIRTTLDQMASQGLYDTLGGGFFRYVVDPYWQVPHYEKMLYDNAQLAVLYLRAAAIYNDARYRRVGLATVDFMLREMARGPVFVSSLSAVDDEGREGFYYQWSEDQLRMALNEEEHTAVLAAWFSERAEASEYGRLPRSQGEPEAIAATLGMSVETLQQRLETARTKLLAERAKRSLPVDEKILAAWNGLALSAFAEAYAASGDKRYATQAEQLSDYLGEVLWDGKRLLRAQHDGETVAASLEDYALVAQGLWDWGSRYPGHCAACEARAGALVRSAWQRYFKDGRWLLDDAALIPMLGGRRALDDGALPSATAVIARLSSTLPGLRADADIQRLLGTHLDAARAALGDSLFWYAGYVELLETH